jgi:nucleoside-diphosphate-sugar epimerase
MRIFLAGASGVIGLRLVPLLVAQGHQVVGMTRSAEKADRLRDLGAEPVVCDVFDAAKLSTVVTEAAPELMMHQLTDLPDTADQISQFRERNDRVRIEGTSNLIGAAQAAGVARLIAQSISWSPPGGGDAVERHERAVLDAGGVVLRYGQLYGPGTYYESERPDPPRVHVDEAARRTAELLDAPGPSIVVVTEAEDAGPA